MHTIAQQLDSALEKAASEAKKESLQTLFDANPERVNTFQCHGAGLSLDYSKQRLNDAHRKLLIELGTAAGLGTRFEALVHGETVNITEQRPALHTLLRGTAGDNSPERYSEVTSALALMQQLVTDIHSGDRRGFTGQPFTDVVNIGIGGSDLGPRMVSRALWTKTPKLQAHFVANVDPQDLDEALHDLDPATTLFIVCSKSFTTEETLSNALRARDWLLNAGAAQSDVAQHVVAVTTNLEAAGEFGIDTEQCYPMWDWVGGRYSVWSAIGLVVALNLGWDAFTEFLEGGHAMDSHTLDAPVAENLPMTLALLEWWNTLYLGTETHLVLPYAQRLSAFTDFLQQLTMESNGKSATVEGQPIEKPTAPVLWGSAGTIGQHSYYQLLHQGNREFSADLILPLTNGDVDTDAHRKLAANALAQSRAFMIGRNEQEARALAESRGQDQLMAAHYGMSGNHPHSLITFNAVTPKTLGALIAAYEHKTFFLGALFNLNPFDQWGVELGKVIGRQIDKVLASGDGLEALDPSTAKAIEAWRAANA